MLGAFWQSVSDTSFILSRREWGYLTLARRGITAYCITRGFTIRFDFSCSWHQLSRH
jgi:hypothetical protein